MIKTSKHYNEIVSTPETYLSILELINTFVFKVVEKPYLARLFLTQGQQNTTEILVESPSKNCALFQILVELFKNKETLE